MILFALMPPVPLSFRLALAILLSLLTSWLTVRVNRTNGMSCRMICAVGLATGFVMFMWILEFSLDPKYWQRELLYSGLTGIVAGVLVGGIGMPKKTKEGSWKLDQQPNPIHQSDTFSTALVQEFECEALSGDDPEVQGRERRGRPSDREEPRPPSDQ